MSPHSQAMMHLVILDSVLHRNIQTPDLPLGEASLKDGLGAIALSKKPLLGARPSGPCCMQMVPPVPIMRTRDSGKVGRLSPLTSFGDMIRDCETRWNTI